MQWHVCPSIQRWLQGGLQVCVELDCTLKALSMMHQQSWRMKVCFANTVVFLSLVWIYSTEDCHLEFHVLLVLYSCE